MTMMILFAFFLPLLETRQCTNVNLEEESVFFAQSSRGPEEKLMQGLSGASRASFLNMQLKNDDIFLFLNMQHKNYEIFLLRKFLFLNMQLNNYEIFLLRKFLFVNMQLKNDEIFLLPKITFSEYATQNLPYRWLLSYFQKNASFLSQLDFLSVKI